MKRLLPPARRMRALPAALALLAAPAAAHVEVILPNGGEVLPAGSVYTIQWTVAITHSLQDWDVWYSTTGPSGPWIEVAMDLPGGSAAVGSIHTYDWLVPDTPSTQIRVRVRMDNSPGIDYYDVSDGDLTITPAGPALIGPVPGTTGTVNSLTVTGATSGGLIGVGYSLTTGTTPVGGTCPAAIVLLENPTVLGLATADASGAAAFGGFVPPSLSGVTVYLQAVDLTGCGVTDLVTHTFP